MDRDLRAAFDDFDARMEARLQLSQDRFVAGFAAQIRASEQRILSVINGYAEINRLRMRERQIRESMPEPYRNMAVF